MPLPMVHLAIAVRAHALADRPLTPEFLLGSLAPDAIHMRPNTDREDKNRVHLNISEASEPEMLDRIRLLIDQNQSVKNGPDPFAEGYASHLLADYWWLQAVARPFTEQLTPHTPAAELRAWYYQETDQIDFNLYHRVLWRNAVWDLLAAADAPEFSPYLAADEIHRWRQRTLDWFEKLSQEPDIVPKMITQPVVERFIESSAQRIQHFLFQRPAMGRNPR